MDMAQLPSTGASDVIARVNSRVTVATTSSWPANLHELFQRYEDQTGVVAVGQAACKLGATCTAEEPFKIADQQDSLLPVLPSQPM
ncbi:hypothetical protein [Flexivirga caeni]|uniref:hypothetical protein n=1 Tax=Flexivirga caeni TaxID=2294115 RepID=UPI0011CEBFBE|nr:hypothetical protein [Flexivirga caeni]